MSCSEKVDELHSLFTNKLPVHMQLVWDLTEKVKELQVKIDKVADLREKMNELQGMYVDSFGYW